jgi:hypothetical protein
LILCAIMISNADMPTVLWDVMLCSLVDTWIKAIPVTGCEGPWGCERSRLPRFLDNRLTDGGEFVSLMHQLPFTPRKIHDTHFCLRLSRPQGHSAAGSIRSIEKIHLIGTRTRDLMACNIVPQPTTLPLAPRYTSIPAFWRNLWPLSSSVLKMEAAGPLKMAGTSLPDYMVLHLRRR